MNENTTDDDGLKETTGYITVGMPDGSRSTVALLQLHVDAINAAMQEGDDPANAVMRLIEKGNDAETLAHRYRVAYALGGMKQPQ